MIEGLVLSCIYQDLTLVTELEPDFFSTDKSIFYFVLAREMSKTIKEVDMISVCAWCNTNGLLQVFEGYGGYESINNLLKLEGNVDNFYSYVDDLRKHVLIGGYTKKTSKGIYELPFTGENSDSRLGKAENIVSVLLIFSWKVLIF